MSANDGGSIAFQRTTSAPSPSPRPRAETVPLRRAASQTIGSVLLDDARLRLLSSAERRGIKAALDAVDGEKQHLEEEGLSQMSFFLGVLNVVAITLVLATIPAYLWVLYSLECLILIPAWFVKMVRQYNGALFALDFCWVSNACFSIYLLLLLFRGVPDSLRLRAFLCFYSSALGPLGWACLALHNGLVFHSIEKITSLFIHMTPTFVAWTVVTFADELAILWPGRFPTAGELEAVTGWQVLGHGCALYICWWVLHSFWLLTSGIYCPAHGHRTVFDELYRKSDLGTAFQRATGWRSLRSHAFLYLVIHFVLCVGWCYPWSVLCFKSRWLHLAFGIGLFVSAAWYGAGYYDYIIAQKYTKVLHQLYERREQ